jgi:DNA-binding transcriptional LysR family regulator
VRPAAPRRVTLLSTGHRRPAGTEEGATSADVTLRQLRYFVMLGEELNYRRAAERLFITQPALSTAIKHLEHQTGVTLFRRNTREVALTDIGATWLPTVREALRGVDGAVDDLIAASRRDRRIRLGYLIGTGADILFRLVRHFELAYPEISVEPREFDFNDPTAGLADGTTEVAIIRPPVDLPDHRMLILDAEDWVACLPRDHRLAQRADLSITELLDDPIVVAPGTAGMWRDYWIAYVPITDRPRNYTALAWNPRALSDDAGALVRQVRDEWSFGEGQSQERPATYS